MPEIETDLAKYVALIDSPLLQEATVYPIEGNRVSLGQKIKAGGFGEGYILGYGGKLDPKDKGKIKVTAQRELWEEARIRVKLRDLVSAGKAYFYFPYGKDPITRNIEVTLFTCREWTGTPRKTKEMDPAWYDISQVPYPLMWDDNKLFLPHVLLGRKVEIHAMYGKDKTVTDYTLKFLDNPAGNQ